MPLAQAMPLRMTIRWKSHTTPLTRMIYSASPMTMNKSLRLKCLKNLNSRNSNAEATTGALKGVSFKKAHGQGYLPTKTLQYRARAKITADEKI